MHKLRTTIVTEPKETVCISTEFLGLAESTRGDTTLFFAPKDKQGNILGALDPETVEMSGLLFPLNIDHAALDALENAIKQLKQKRSAIENNTN